MTLDATFAGATYVWSTGATSAAITVDQTGTYSVTADLNGCTASDQVTVNVIDVAEVDLGTDLSACSDQLPLLDATIPGATYSWNTGATSATLPVAATGVYWVEVTVGNCSAIDSIDVVINPAPGADLGEVEFVFRKRPVGSEGATYEIGIQRDLALH